MNPYSTFDVHFISSLINAFELTEWLSDWIRCHLTFNKWPSWRHWALSQFRIYLDWPNANRNRVYHDNKMLFLCWSLDLHSTAANDFLWAISRTNSMYICTYWKCTRPFVVPRLENKLLGAKSNTQSGIIKSLKCSISSNSPVEIEWTNGRRRFFLFFSYFQRIYLISFACVIQLNGLCWKLT